MPYFAFCKGSLQSCWDWYKRSWGLYSCPCLWRISVRSFVHITYLRDFWLMKRTNAKPFTCYPWSMASTDLTNERMEIRPRFIQYHYRRYSSCNNLSTGQIWKCRHHYMGHAASHRQHWPVTNRCLWSRVWVTICNWAYHSDMYSNRWYEQWESVYFRRFGW